MTLLSASTEKSRPAIALSVALVGIPGMAWLFVPRHSAEDMALRAVTFVLAWCMLRWRGLKWADVGLNTPSNPKRQATVALAGAVLITVGAELLKPAIQVLIGREPDHGDFAMVRGNAGWLVVWLVVGWVAAFVEELFFRGFLMNSLHAIIPVRSAALGRWLVAMALTSLAFGCGHANQGPAGMILTGVAGLGFGVIYLLNRRNLWPCILAHGFVNTIGFSLLFLESPA